MSKFKIGDVLQRKADWEYTSAKIKAGLGYVVETIAYMKSGEDHIRFEGIEGVFGSDDFEYYQEKIQTPFSELKHWKKEALRMHYAGKPHGVIAEALGKPYFTITTHLRRYKPRYSKEVVEDFYDTQCVGHKVDHAYIDEAETQWEVSDQSVLFDRIRKKVPQRKKPTIFVIGDTQVKQGVSLEYIHWVGNYIAAKKPDIIVHIGDHYDMAALSSYDKGMLSAEGRRVKADIDAGDEALEIIDRYIKSAKGYNPRKVVTLGNHEDRINRFVNTHPEFDGYIGTDKLAFHKLGWEVSPFLTPVNIEGINFVHYIQNVMTGKPLSGTVVNMLKTVGESFVMGHKQVLEHTLRYLPLSGKPQIGIIVGACYDHDESYKGVQGNHHFRGCVMLYECQEGSAMSKPVSLQHMKELYEVSK